MVSHWPRLCRESMATRGRHNLIGLGVRMSGTGRFPHIINLVSPRYKCFQVIQLSLDKSYRWVHQEGRRNQERTPIQGSTHLACLPFLNSRTVYFDPLVQQEVSTIKKQ